MLVVTATRTKIKSENLRQDSVLFWEEYVKHINSLVPWAKPFWHLNFTIRHQVSRRFLYFIASGWGIIVSLIIYLHFSPYTPQRSVNPINLIIPKSRVPSLEFYKTLNKGLALCASWGVVEEGNEMQVYILAYYLIHNYPRSCMLLSSLLLSSSSTNIRSLSLKFK